MTAVPALLDAKSTHTNRRKSSRRKLHLPTLGSLASGSADVLILNVSTTGLLLETAAELAKGEVIELELPDGIAAQAVVKWTSGRLFGCEFKEPISIAAISAALLQAPSHPGSWESFLQAQATGASDELLDDGMPHEDRSAWSITGLVILVSVLVTAAVLLV